jgi:hypothetical protein
MALTNKLVLHHTRLDKLVWNKQSSLLGPFVSYEEKEVLLVYDRKTTLG